MKCILLLLSALSASSLFGETWYAYCVVTSNAVRYCTYPEEKTDAMEIQCMNLATKLGVRTYDTQASTDLAALETGMVEHCDEMSGTDNGSIYACQISTLCGAEAPRVSHLQSRVYSRTRNGAINRCANENTPKITQKLKEQSAAGCYLKLVVQKVN